MTDAIKALRDAVVDGSGPGSVNLPWNRVLSFSDVCGAYNSSLNAALRLHEKLLPEWKCGFRMHEGIEGSGWHVWLKSPDYNISHWTAGGEERSEVTRGRLIRYDNDNPARALLLAILDALIGEKE